ncbi:MAG: M3 family oligoendopeptidase [Candidatus Dormibacteria bacterium]
MAQKVEPGPAKARGVRWDLSQIHRDPEDACSALHQLLADAGEFQLRWRGRVSVLEAEELAHLLHELGQLTDRSRTSSAYCELRNCADSTLAENQDLQSDGDQALIEFANRTRFFQLEWQEIPSTRARDLARTEPLRPYQHFLERLTDQAKHRLSAEVETALAERSTAAVAAWQQLFGETTSRIVAAFSPDGEANQMCTIAELLAYQRDHRREVRRIASDTLYAALEPWTAVLARTYDTLVLDRLGQDRLRRYVSADDPSIQLPMQQANRANDLPDAIVDRLPEAVAGKYGTAQRYFRIKARQLGLEKLALFDQYAPFGPEPACRYEEGRELVVAAMRRFSPEAEKILARFFTENRIDAEPRAGKQGGAFCESVAQAKESYILVNYTDLLKDAQTLAHELGHGLHASLAKRHQGPLVYETGLGLAEMASTFNEMLLFDHLMAGDLAEEARRRLVAARVEQSFLTVFTQTMMARYEQGAYAARRQGQSLTADRLAHLWMTESGQYFGDTVELPAGSRFTWAYIPHFFFARFYTYSYAFAHLVSLALYRQYLADRPGFVPRYLELLGAGGSQSPKELLLAMGIDIADPAWTEPAFELINSWIDQVEQDTGARTGANRPAG